MSFQAYLDTIKEKTGKTPEDFIRMAQEKGFIGQGVKAGDIIDWLKSDFDLGRGHAMAIVNILKSVDAPKLDINERVDTLFTGNKSAWRATYDDLMAKLQALGDVSVSTTDTYISLLKGKKKFGIIAITGDRMDVGIKNKTLLAEGRLEEAGSWNTMVTHRVRITDANQIDEELLSWLRQAFDKA